MICLCMPLNDETTTASFSFCRIYRHYEAVYRIVYFSYSTSIVPNKNIQEFFKGIFCVLIYQSVYLYEVRQDSKIIFVTMLIKNNRKWAITLMQGAQQGYWWSMYLQLCITKNPVRFCVSERRVNCIEVQLYFRLSCEIHSLFLTTFLTSGVEIYKLRKR